MCDCQEQQWSYLEVKQTVKQIFDIILNYIFQEHGKVLVADAENVVEAVDKIIETLNYDELQRNIEDAIIYLLPPKSRDRNKIHEINCSIGCGMDTGALCRGNVVICTGK